MAVLELPFPEIFHKFRRNGRYCKVKLQRWEGDKGSREEIVKAKVQIERLLFQISIDTRPRTQPHHEAADDLGQVKIQ